jgi:serine/threonine-protein kinase
VQGLAAAAAAEGPSSTPTPVTKTRLDPFATTQDFPGDATEPDAATTTARASRLRRAGLALAAMALAGLAAYIFIPRRSPRPVAEAEFAATPPPASLKPAVVAQAGGPEPPAVKVNVSEPTPTPVPDRPKPDPVPAESTAGESGPGLAQVAHGLLKKYCYRCHGVRFEVPGYNVLDRDILVANRGEDEPAYVVPGKPGESYLWERVGVEKDMPPSGPKPSDDERAVFRTWIAAGAPFPTADPSTRPLQTDKEVLAAIRDHLRRAPASDRTYLRYFTLANLHNNKDVSDDDLRLARAAVAKLANSLSWKSEIAVLKAIDPAETILVLDVRDVGWDERDLWKKILVRYPYGLKHDKDRDAAIRTLAQEVYALSGSSMPYVRADWFVASAARPPLYETLLDLPADATALERMLKVDVAADFLRDRLARAGFATSGVSSQNRLVDRHPALYGAYWKSYDFKHNEGKGNLFRFPLGPVFKDHPFPAQAFEHAGGEIIFNLPNGLQGYLLVDAQDRRIAAGPVEVVSDALRTGGTAAIVPGLSCMACHQHGMIPFKDTIRAGLAVAGDARAKAERLFPEKEPMDKLLEKDEARFLKALDEAAGPFLKAGEDQKKPIKEFPEPIGAVARAYMKDLGPEEVAAELGFGDPKDLAAAIKANPRLRQLGLGPLLQGAAIKRTEWDSLDGRFISTFQDAAHELDLGTPFRSF